MVEEQLQVCKAALESRLGSRIPCSPPVMGWLVEHCADIVNRYSVNKTGMSPYEKRHGKKAIKSRAEFGEMIYYSISSGRLASTWDMPGTTPGTAMTFCWKSKLGNVRNA